MRIAQEENTVSYFFLILPRLSTHSLKQKLLEKLSKNNNSEFLRRLTTLEEKMVIIFMANANAKDFFSHSIFFSHFFFSMML